MAYNNTNPDNNNNWDANKYYFPSGTIPDSQPELEVPAERDEQGALPGLQLVPDEQQKHAHHDVQGLYGRCARPLPAGQAVHADELTSQGLQAAFVEQGNAPVAVDATQNQWAYQEGWSQPAEQHYYYGQTPHAGGPFLPVTSEGLEVYTNAPSSITTPDPYLAKGEDVAPASSEARSGRRRKCIIGGVILALIVVIVGAVVGGVLGSRASRNKGAPESDSNTNGTAATVSPQSIRTNSRLAVTGFRGNDGNFSLRLFFQDPDNQLRFMDKTSEDSKWSEPVILDTLDYEPLVEGPIAAGSYLRSSPPQIELFYLDKTSTIRGQFFTFEQSQYGLKGTRSNINDYPLQVADNTSIACYFPYIMSQDRDNQLRFSRMLGRAGDNITTLWVNDTDTDTEGSRGTGLALLPMGQAFRDDAGFVYRDGESMTTGIKVFSDERVADYSWSKGNLSIRIPADSPIGAFVVGRPYDADNQINTNVLFQDASGIIQVVRQDGEDGDTSWKGPETYDVFSNAEMGTDIACLTPGAWDAYNIKITSEKDMNRCFFQEKGTKRVKEVWFDGTTWKDEGYVPLK